MGLSADAFEQRYGAYVRRHFGWCPTAYKLRAAVSARYPFVKVSEGVLKSWIGKYRIPEGAARVSTVSGMVELLGDELDAYSRSNGSAFKLVRALRGRVPPVYVTDAAARTWFQRYHGRLHAVSYTHLTLPTILLV